MGGGTGTGVLVKRKGRYGGAGEINGGELQPQKGQGGGLGDGGQWGWGGALRDELGLEDKGGQRALTGWGQQPGEGGP